MRIAYCLLIHKNPEQVSRLIERIYSPSDYFFIHMDKRVPYDEQWEDALRKYRKENVFFAPLRYKTPRGPLGLVEATLGGMNQFRSLDYDYFVHLTGQCYPIKPVNVMKEELGSKEVAYVEYFKLPSSHWEKENGGLDRISYYHIYLGEIFRMLWIRIPRLKRTLPYNLDPYGGSHFFCLPKRFVNFVLEYVSSHPEIVRFFRHSRIPCEMFFQTILMNSSLRSDVVNDNRWFIRWTEGPLGHPTVLTKEDFSEIMRSDKLFARKFDMSVDKDILDLIDRAIHG